MPEDDAPGPRPAAAQRLARAPGAPPAGPPTMIVMVEDDPRDALLIDDMLRTADARYVVRRATTFNEALALVPPVDTPTCVLLDLSLPDAAGLEGLAGIRRFAPHAPVVVLTGNDDDTVCLRALGTGAQDYLVKGRMTPDALQRSIRYAVERKSSENALFNMEERFRFALENSPMGIALLTAQAAEGGQVIDANRAFATMLGRPLHSVLGEALLDYVHEEDAAEFALDLHALVHGRIARVQLRHRLVTSGGQVVLCSITASLLRHPLGEPPCVLAMFEDITVSARREGELRQALDALDKVAHGVARLDLDGNLLSVNRAYASALGYDANEMIGAPWVIAVHEDDRETVREAIALASCGDPQRAELLAQRRDGSTFEAEIELVAHRDPEARPAGVHFFLRDITGEKETERALRVSQEQCRQIVETTNEGVWIMDSDGTTALVNSKMCEILAADPDELRGHGVLNMAFCEDRSALLALVRPPTGATSRPIDVRFRRTDGEEVWGMVVSRPLWRPATGERMTLAMVTDITDRKRAELQLAHRTLHDDLTQLPNRALLIDRLRYVLLQARRRHTMVGVFVVDLHGFKNVSDTLGHAAGDALLTSIAPRLRDALRASDTLARLGREALVVLCADLADERQALSIVERLLEVVVMPVQIGAAEVSVTASVGITFSRADELQAEDMIRDAETAMYRAKRRGGGAYEIFDSQMGAEMLAQSSLEEQIKDSLRLGHFQLVYQPIFDLDRQAMVGCEALIRWHHPERGIVAPGEFIPVAERTGLIRQLGDWVMSEACHQLAQWTETDPALGGVTMWINIAARQLDDRGFPQRVREVTAAAGINPSRLRFELTETGIVDLNSQVAAAVLAELADDGIQLVLDDFGTGSSSLTYLRRLPVAGLKLDGSFASQMGVERAVPPIVEAVAGMAQSLGLWLVAEGIETREQLEAIAAYGCDMAQGFLLGRPMAPDTLASWALQDRPELASRSRSRPDGRWVGLKEAALHLGVSVSTVRRWADTGRLISERTHGGHRRLLVADVGREARLRNGSVRLNKVTPPTTPLPTVAAELAATAELLLAFASRQTYQAHARGWFASEAAQAPQREWALALAEAARDGDYAPALQASNALFRNAALSGATALERHLFFSAFRAALLRQIRGAASEAELIGARRLAVAIEHAVVGLP